ncbi:MAG: hypothetical protein ACOYYS_23400 [Chloroflexota bacterium]
MAQALAAWFFALLTLWTSNFGWGWLAVLVAVWFSFVAANFYSERVFVALEQPERAQSGLADSAPVLAAAVRNEVVAYPLETLVHCNFFMLFDGFRSKLVIRPETQEVENEAKASSCVDSVLLPVAIYKLELHFWPEAFLNGPDNIRKLYEFILPALFFPLALFMIVEAIIYRRRNMSS